MNKRRHTFALFSQLLIILTFFVGMLLNISLIRPVVADEEMGRIQGEINVFCSNILRNIRNVNFDYRNLDTLYDALSDSNPQYGHFCIFDDSDSLLLDSEKCGINSMALIDSLYGDKAISVISEDRKYPENIGVIKYDYGTDMYYYARYDKGLGLTFFYGVNYFKAASRALHTFYVLLLVMLCGGVLIIIICFINLRKMGRKELKEIASIKELETAAAIQKAMLPRENRQLMQMDLDARLKSALLVGGDLYYHYLGNGQLYICIGDVSGKGIAASLCMSRAVTLFRSMAQRGKAASEIARSMNEELCRNNDQNIFLTAFLGVLQVYDGQLTFCNAGHDEPLYWSGVPGESPEFLNTSLNLPLGFDSSSKYVEGRMTLDPGSLLLLYTDGVNEARNRQGMMYGNDRFRDFIEGVKSESAVVINDRLMESLHAFADGAQQSDDITLLTLRRITQTKTFTITNDSRELRRLPVFINEIFDECYLSEKDKVRVRSGIDEAVTNCVKYAYDEPGGKIVLSAFIQDENLVFVLMDNGREFDPLSYEAPEREPLQIGGLGITMMKSSFDSLEYHRIGDSNILTIKKKLK